jgi:hypothetical protein
MSIEPQRYPIVLRHPQATAIPRRAGALPDIVVNSPEEELAWTRRGWDIGSQFAPAPPRGAEAHKERDPTETTPEDEGGNPASSPSQAQTEQPEATP